MRIVFSLYFNSFAYIGEKKDENCTSIRTENSLAFLIPNQFVLDDCPREYSTEAYQCQKNTFLFLICTF